MPSTAPMPRPPSRRRASTSACSATTWPTSSRPCQWPCSKRPKPGMRTISARCFGTTGPTVVLVHGWCCSGDFWRRQVAAFADRYRLVVLDLGHPDPSTDDLLISAAAGVEVAELITPDLVGLETCAIVGH